MNLYYFSCYCVDLSINEKNNSINKDRAIAASRTFFSEPVQVQGCEGFVRKKLPTKAARL